MVLEMYTICDSFVFVCTASRTISDIIDAKPIGLHPTNTPHQLGPSHRAKHYPSSQCYGPTSSDRGSQSL